MLKSRICRINLYSFSQFIFGTSAKVHQIAWLSRIRPHLLQQRAKTTATGGVQTKRRRRDKDNQVRGTQ